MIKKFGQVLVSAAPFLMKALSWIGTFAMFLVGGTFVAEGIPPLEHAIEAAVTASAGWRATLKIAFSGVVGLMAGFVAAVTISGISRFRKLGAN